MLSTTEVRVGEAMTPYEQCKSNLIELQNRLLSSHPQMPQLLQTIHRQLKNDPEIVTLMTEEEVSIVVQGLARQTNNVFAESLAKPSKAKKESLKNVKDEDLF